MCAIWTSWAAILGPGEAHSRIGPVRLGKKRRGDKDVVGSGAQTGGGSGGWTGGRSVRLVRKRRGRKKRMGEEKEEEIR